MTIHCKGHERANVEKVLQSAVLVRLEDGRHGAALCVQLCEEVCSHRLAVHHKMVQMHHFSHLLVGCEYLGDALRQMQIAAMSGNQEWMPLLIMQ